MPARQLRLIELFDGQSITLRREYPGFELDMVFLFGEKRRERKTGGRFIGISRILTPGSRRPPVPAICSWFVA
jgi:hypothetical protein